MLRMNFDGGSGSPLKLLCLGAHADDLEIGCGGSILRLLKERKDTEVHWVVFGAEGERAVEAKESAAVFLRHAGRKDVVVNSFKDSYFPYVGGKIKEYFEQIKARFTPDLIFTHLRHDMHQDHRLISELTWNTFRNQLILEYEIPKYDGDLGNTNFYFHLDPEVCREKIESVLACFKSQRGNHWFTEDTFMSILRIRGIESNAPGSYAEGFYSRKMTY